LLEFNNVYNIKEEIKNSKEMIIQKSINRSILDESFKTINFCVANDLLCLNVGYKIIHILKIEKLKPPSNNNFLGLKINFGLPSLNNSNQKSVKFYKIYDLFAFKSSNFSRFLGFWFNSNFNKLSIVKEINIRDKNYKFIELNIIKIDVQEGRSEILLKKNFEKIITYDDFRCSYSEKYANFFIFDNSEIYNFSLIDKEEKILNDLQNNLLNNEISFNLIYNNFNKFEYSQRVYVVFKILRNYQKIGMNIEKIFEDKKLSYMIDSIINNYEGTKNYDNLNNIYLDHFAENGNFENEKIIGNSRKNMISYIDNKEELMENYKSVYYDNLIHIFNMFIRNQNFYFIYKLLRKYLKIYFNFLTFTKNYSNSINKDFFEKIYSKSRFDYNIEKKIMKMIDKIIVYSICKFSYSKKDEKSRLIDKINNDFESESTYKQDSILDLKKNLEFNNFENNKKLEILTDILKFNYSLQNKYISNNTKNLIIKIFYSKIKVYEKFSNGKNLPLMEEKEIIKLEDIYIDEIIFEGDDSVKFNLEYFANLLEFETLSKLFLKMRDYKKTIKSLIYGNNYKEIFELIKQKKIPLEKIEYEFINIIEYFNVEQILFFIEMLYNEKISTIKKEKSFTLEKFLNSILEINIKHLNPKTTLKELKNDNILHIETAFDIFHVLETIILSENIKYLSDDSTAENYLRYILDILLYEIKILKLITDEPFKKEKKKNLEKNINITLIYIEAYNRLNLKKILEDYKFELYNNFDLYPLLTKIYEKLKEFNSIIDIQIDIYKDPEVSIRFIDILNISQNKKEELFEYLKNKIIKSSDLTPIKKFYFVNLFEDEDEVILFYNYKFKFMITFI